MHPLRNISIKFYVFYEHFFRLCVTQQMLGLPRRRKKNLKEERNFFVLIGRSETPRSIDKTPSETLLYLHISCVYEIQSLSFLIENIERTKFYSPENNAHYYHYSEFIAMLYSSRSTGH